jgi:hypothetical protein
MRIHFRRSVLLSLGALLLTLCLSVAGKIQTARDVGGQMVWDYLAPGEVMLHSINFPATVATTLLTGDHSFRIGIEYSTIGFLVYLACVELLWFSVGFLIDLPQETPLKRSWTVTISVFLFIYALFLLLVTGTVWNMYSLLFALSGFIWSIVLMALAIRLLFVFRKRR